MSPGQGPPILQVLRGPNEGRFYPLSRPRSTIGRLPTNDIVLAEKDVSRLHAIIEHRGGGHFLRDNKSTWGTFVDGDRLLAPVRLHNGATFRVGESLFGFYESPEPPGASLDESSVLATIDAFAKTDHRPGQHHAALLETLRELGGSLELDDVLDRLTNALLRLFPASQRVVVFLKDEGDGHLRPHCLRSPEGTGRVDDISHGVLRRVLDHRQGILCRNPTLEFSDSESVSNLGLRSLIATPLIDAHRQILGVIELDITGHHGPFDAADLETLTAVAAPVAVAIENARLHKKLLRETQYEAGLLAAHRVLTDLLPAPLCTLAGYDCWSTYRPARYIGGDYLGCLPLPRADDPPGGPARRWAIAVGDVAGKGLPAALHVARLSAEVRLALKGEVDPAASLRHLNANLGAEGGGDETLVTFLLLVIDAVEHRATYVSAGHLPPLIRRAATGRIEATDIAANGQPLPWLDETPFRAVEFSLDPGDMVVLCTDGIFEARNDQGLELGLPALHAVIESTAADAGAAAMGEAILGRVAEHARNHPPSDDIALLCFRREAD